MRATAQRYYRLSSNARLGEVGATQMRSAQMKGRRLTMETVSVWAAFVLMVACNAAFEMMRLNSTTVAEVSSQVFAWFSPAPYAFFIWGVIYAALAVWLVNFTYDAPNRATQFSFEALMFIATCVLNVLWLALFHFEQIAVALLVIAALWVTVGALYFTTRREIASPTAWVPLSIYVSWLTVATVVNAVNLLTRLIDGGVPLLNQALVVLLAAGVLAVAYAVQKAMEDPVFPLVVIWAVVAVGVHVLAVSPVLAVLVFSLVIVAAALMYVPFDRLKSSMRKGRAHSV